MIRGNTETFLTKVLERHPDNINKFDYSEVVYTLAKNKVILTCLKCSHRFAQVANSHFRGVGCPACAGNIKDTTASFIEKAKEVHGDKYDYSVTEHAGSHKKVKILCKLHGTFEQTPHSHLQGQGCLRCAGRSILSQDDFIRHSKIKHADTYDYSLVNYVHTHHKVDIVCKQHGVFQQTPANHLQGQGCPKCAHSYPLDTQTFIERATEAHNGFYSYDSAEYVTAKVELTITCPIHGDFRQAAHSHIKGNGCPVCRKETSKGGVNLRSMLKRPETYRTTESYLYFIEILDGKGTFKIGKGNLPTMRVANIKAQSGFDCELTYQIPSSTYNVLLVEQYLHDLLKHRRSDVVGFGGYTECFFLEPEEVSDAIEFADNLLKDTSEIETYYRDLYKVYKE